MFGPDDLGRAIKRLRGSRTQRECGEVAGISPSAWSLYESGSRMPRKGMFARLAKGLGVEPPVLEEAAWEERNQRLAAEDPAGRPTEPPGFAEREPLLRAVSEHTQAIAYHLNQLVLLILQPQDSR